MDSLDSQCFNLVIKFSYFIATILGLTPVAWNFKNRNFKKSSILTAYSIFANVVILLLAAHNFFRHSSGSYVNDKLTIRLIRFGKDLLIFVAIFSLIWQFLFKRKHIVTGYQFYARLYEKRYDGPSKILLSDIYKYNSLLILKFCIASLKILSEIIQIFYFKNNEKLSFYVGVCINSFVKIFITATLNQFIFYVVSIGKHLRFINEELADLMTSLEFQNNYASRYHQRSIKAFSFMLASELYGLAQRHSECFALFKIIMRIYQYSGITMLFMSYLANVKMLYHAVLFFKNSQKASYISIFFTISRLVLFFASELLATVIIAKVQKEYKKTGNVLQKITEYENMNDNLIHNVNIL